MPHGVVRAAQQDLGLCQPQANDARIGRFAEAALERRDEVVALHAYAECSKIVFLHHPTYYYRIRGNSITTSEFSLRNMDYYYNSQDNLSFIRIRMPQLIPCAEYKVYKSLLYCYVNLRKLEKTPQTEQLKKKLREDIRHHRKAALKNHYLDRKFKLLFFLIR